MLIVWVRDWGLDLWCIVPNNVTPAGDLIFQGFRIHIWTMGIVLATEGSEVLVAQLCVTLLDPTGCSLLGSPVHGILQARILGRMAISFSRGSSRLRDWTQLSCIAGRFFTIWATRKLLWSTLNGVVPGGFQNLEHNHSSSYPVILASAFTKQQFEGVEATGKQFEGVHCK